MVAQIPAMENDSIAMPRPLASPDVSSVCPQRWAGSGALNSQDPKGQG